MGAAYPTLLKELIDETLQCGKACGEKATPVRFEPADV
jgi:hypothetical protein